MSSLAYLFNSNNCLPAENVLFDVDLPHEVVHEGIYETDFGTFRASWNHFSGKTHFAGI